MPEFRPAVQVYMQACEHILTMLARREPLTTDEQDVIEMLCIEILSKLPRRID